MDERSTTHPMDEEPIFPGKGAASVEQARAARQLDTDERLALRDLQETAEWYVHCLDDVRAQRPVRGLDEAEAAYASAQKRAKAVLDR